MQIKDIDYLKTVDGKIIGGSSNLALVQQALNDFRLISQAQIQSNARQAAVEQSARAVANLIR